MLTKIYASELSRKSVVCALLVGHVPRPYPQHDTENRTLHYNAGHA